MLSIDWSRVHRPICNANGPRSHVADKGTPPCRVPGTFIDFIGALHHHTLNVPVQLYEPVVFDTVDNPIDGVTMTECAACRIRMPRTLVKMGGLPGTIFGSRRPEVSVPLLMHTPPCLSCVSPVGQALLGHLPQRERGSLDSEVQVVPSDGSGIRRRRSHHSLLCIWAHHLSGPISHSLNPANVSQGQELRSMPHFV